MFRKSRASTLSVLVGAIVLSFAVVPQAIAAPIPGVQGDLTPIADPAAFAVNGGAWFMNPATVPLVNPKFYILQGSPQDGGFAYSISLTSPTSGSDIAAVEVAISPQGRQLVAVGTPAADWPKPVGSLAGQGSAAAPASTSVESVSPLTSSYRTGEFLTIWQDPLGIIVNEVADRINWYYDGTYVTSFTGSSFWNWFSGNGWHPVGSPYVGSYYNSNHTWGTVYTNAQFETSSWFPLPTCGTTDIYYQANNVYGGGNGQLSGGVNTWGTGGCMFLLHWLAGTHP